MKKALLIAVLTFAAGILMGFPRISVAEIISTTWCGPCGPVHTYMDENYPEIYDEAVLLDFITDTLGSEEVDPYCYTIYWLYNPDEDAYYIPSGGTDGTWGFVGSGAPEDIIAHLTSAAGTETPVGLWFEGVTDDTAYVAVTIDDSTAGGDYRLFVFLLESHIIIPGTTIDEYNWTVRDMLTGETGEDFTIAYGDTLHFAVPFVYGTDWVIAECELAAFIDNGEDHVILQGAHGTLPAPEYYYVLHDEGTFLMGEPGEEMIFSITIENSGLSGDTIDMHLETEIPTTWAVEATTPYSTFDEDGWVEVASATFETVFVSFITDTVEIGSGASILTFTSRATGRTYEIEFGVSTGGGILIVDDDQGDDYGHYYTDAMDNIGMNYVVFDRSSAVPTIEGMTRFDAVIWFTGSPWTDVIVADDEDVIGGFLDGGGKLFLTSQETGYDIGTTPFYENYLHALYVADEAASRDINGVDANPISDGLSFSIEGGDGANNQNYPDVISPLGDAEPVFYYGAGTAECAGLMYDDVYRLVYLSFGFEGISAQEDRDSVMSRVLTWLAGTGVSENKDIKIRELAISASPNPFNSSCKISVSLPDGGDVMIYDLSGKMVAPVETKLSPGEYSLIFSAEALPSGIYFAVAKSKNSIATKRILLVQ